MEKQKLAAACVFLSPFLPLLFMGEEFAETNPFLYFVDHQDKELVEAVRQGRKSEFSGFDWEGAVPDPADIATFQRSKLKWENLNSEMLECYKGLISFSKKIRRDKLFERGQIQSEVIGEHKVIRLKSLKPNSLFEVYFSFSEKLEMLKIITPGQIIFATSDKAQFQNSMLSLPAFSAVALGS